MIMGDLNAIIGMDMENMWVAGRYEEETISNIYIYIIYPRISTEQPKQLELKNRYKQRVREDLEILKKH